ncbi:MAG: hypothetical protein K1060chlam2_01148 [Chlamydiae bacterium]|nr:hypothetical protein [Chlamydiota bacterium]
MAISTRRLECISSFTLIALTYLVRSRFKVLSTNDLILSGALTAGAILGVDSLKPEGPYERVTATLLKCALIAAIAITTPMITNRLQGERFLGKHFSIGLGSSVLHGALILEILLLTTIMSVPLGFFTTNYTASQFFKEFTIRVHRDELEKKPLKHMKALSYLMERALRTRTFFKFDVSFLREEGVDAGGVTRDYLNSLFQGAVKQEDRFTISRDEGLAMPNVPLDSRSNRLKADDQTFFVEMGKVLMYIFRTPTFKVNKHSFDPDVIGKHFDDALFKVLFCLTAEEIDTPYEKLSPDSKLKMARALFDEESKLLDLIDKGRPLSKAEAVKVLGEERPFTPEELRELFFKEYEGDRRLAPIHAIARGMKGLSCPSNENMGNNQYWNIFIQQNREFSDTFNTKVQGTLDKKVVSKRIAIYKDAGNNVSQKGQWIKEWIKKDATNREVGLFLKFITGSSSSPLRGKKIIIHKLSKEEVRKGIEVRVATCGPSLFLSYEPSENSTGDAKENFINYLKAMIHSDGRFNSR